MQEVIRILAIPPILRILTFDNYLIQYMYWPILNLFLVEALTRIADMPIITISRFDLLQLNLASDGEPVEGR